MHCNGRLNLSTHDNCFCLVFIKSQSIDKGATISGSCLSFSPSLYNTSLGTTNKVDMGYYENMDITMRLVPDPSLPCQEPHTPGLG